MRVINNLWLYSSVTSRLQWYSGVGSPVVADKSVPLMYQVSYMYYSAVGTLIGLFVGIIVSLLTGPQDLTKLNPDLVIPQIRRFLPQKQQITPLPEEYKLIKPDLQTIPAATIDAWKDLWQLLNIKCFASSLCSLHMVKYITRNNNNASWKLHSLQTNEEIKKM